MVELGRQRLGRVEMERKKAIQYRTPLAGVCEQGCGTGWEVSELGKDLYTVHMSGCSKLLGQKKRKQNA